MSIFGDAPKDWPTAYVAHAGQDEVIEAIGKNLQLPEADQAAIIEIIASRGWGKTLFMVGDIVHPYLCQNPNVKAMWVAPTYQVAMSPVEDVYRGVDETTGKKWISDDDGHGNKI